MPSGSYTSYRSSTQRFATWLGCCVALVVGLLTQTAAALTLAPMCDSSASSVNAPLPAPPSADGEIQACDFGVSRFVQSGEPAPEDTPRATPRVERPLGVCREQLVEVTTTRFAFLPDLPRFRGELGSFGPEHRPALDRPPQPRAQIR